MEASIALKNVSKHLKNRYILSNLNFGIEKGSTFVVLGRNGEGKSTFLKLLAGLYQPSNGKIYIDGKNFSENQELIYNIGYLGEIPIFDEHKTVLENLKNRAGFLGMTENKFKKNFQSLASRLLMDSHFDEIVANCSTGIKKRLSIMLSLLHNPSILIWDEPLANLDFNLRKIIIDYLLELKGQKTVVIATNEFTELHTLADRWIVLHNKGVRFDGDLEKMMTQNDLPFLGQIELKTDYKTVFNDISGNPLVIKIWKAGNSINFHCKNLTDFYAILENIDQDNLLRITCNSLELEELLNQLLSDEGLV